MVETPEHITSANNPLIKDLRKLTTGSTAYRKLGRVWLEGDHLADAALLRGFKPVLALFSESFWPLAQSIYARAAIKIRAINLLILILWRSLKTNRQTKKSRASPAFSFPRTAKY